MVLENFDNHSIDLIYARPHQDLSSWSQELQQVSNFGLKHISLYQLTIEEGTYFFKKGIEPLEEEAATNMYIFTQNYLNENGYPQYEVSNFSQPSYSSRHNLLYWQGDDYLGIGKSAHGRLKNHGKFYATIHHRAIEELTAQERAQELIIMGLRLVEGINKKHFFEICGITFNNFVNQKNLDYLKKESFIIETSEYLAATPKGFLVLNKLIEDLC